MAIATHNPAAGETIKTFTPHDNTQVDTIVQRVARAAALARAAQVRRERRDHYADLIASETGKPVGEARAPLGRV